MRNELREFIREENKYADLLKSNPQYRLCGSQDKKVVIGIIQGNPEEYKETDHLNFKYFDTWKDACMQLS